MNTASRNAHNLREKLPPPGNTPIEHLRHTLAAHADTPHDGMAVLATSGVYDTRTGLTYGDLRALLTLLDA